MRAENIDGVKPAERAHRIAALIEKLSARADWQISTLQVEAHGQKTILIKTKTDILFAVFPGDVDPDSGETIEQAAQSAAAMLKKVLDDRAAQLRWSYILKGIGLCAAATLIYLLIVWGVLRVKNLAIAKLDRMIAESRRSLSVAGINMVPILLVIERFVTKLSFLVMIFMVTYIWLAFCFAQFFYTQPWATDLGEYLMGLLQHFALGIIGAVPGLFAVVVIFWLTRIVAVAVSRFFSGVEKGAISVEWLHPHSARASRRIVLVVIWIFTLTVAYPYIPGSGSDAFKGISVFAGLMISLGSTGFISHLMSGLVLAYSGAMSEGDYVVFGDIEGTVRELGPMTTKIMTPAKQFVTIPNGVVTGSSVTNYTRLAEKDGAIMNTTVTIGYDTPWRQVHALLMSAADHIKGIRKFPAPLVRQKALCDFYVEYLLAFHIDRPAERIPIMSELHAAIQDAFNEAGVQIMSPNFVSQPENAILVPKSQWYAPPASPPENQHT
ncbi:MAG: mechanosensitive ion channel family protein [Desulfatitalea sp.]|nr:mechanosensitive ion channel family protein [Desulfatitalea sp.]